MAYTVTDHSKSETKFDTQLEAYLAQLPSCEPWLKNNSEARASVERGIQQAKEGLGVYLGSFAEFADAEIED